MLMSGSALDKDLREATVLAAEEHAATQVGTVSVRLREAPTGGTPSGALQAFKALWSEGVRVFLVGGDGEELEALCRYVEDSGREALLVSPTALTSTSSCPALVSLSPHHGALIVAEVAKLAGIGLTHLIPVVTSREMKQVAHVVAAGRAQGITVASPVQLQVHNTSTSHLKEILAASPRAGVWMSLGTDLPEIMASVGHDLLGRLVMLHTHPAHRAQLLNHPVARTTAEACAVCTVAWAGSSQVDALSRRRLLLALVTQNPLVAALAYDAATLALMAITYTHVSDISKLRENLLAHASVAGVTKPGDVLGGRVSGWSVRMRLVAKHLLGHVVLQESPWLLEGVTRVEGGEGQPWAVVQENHSPTCLVTQEEILALAKNASCGIKAWVEVTAHDPLTHQPVTTAWQSTEAPHVLLVPNGSPRGFSVRAWCQNHQGNPDVEIGCQGATTHNDFLRCVSAISDGFLGSRRRIVRSLVTRHGFPIHHRKKYGPFTKSWKKLKAFLTHKDFSAMIPQIGGCLGASGGCAFCYVFILRFDFDVSPGVCFGACGVAVGGSCGTLFAKGIQYKLDHTVVCTELFTQGRLSLSSYLADASYGARLATTNARALHGYHLMATPLVAVMQVSPTITDIVETMARPWVRHMEYQEGLQVDDDVLGYLVTTLGLPLCSLVAVVVDHVDTIALVAMMAALCRQART